MWCHLRKNEFRQFQIFKNWRALVPKTRHSSVIMGKTIQKCFIYQIPVRQYKIWFVRIPPTVPFISASLISLKAFEIAETEADTEWRVLK